MPGNAEALLSKLDEMRGSAIIKKDGGVLVSRLPSGVDPKELSKKALGLMSSARIYSEKIGSQQITHVVVNGSDGILAVGQNGDFLIIGIMGPELDADSAASKIKKAAESLRELA